VRISGTVWHRINACAANDTPRASVQPQSDSAQKPQRTVVREDFEHCPAQDQRLRSKYKVAEKDPSNLIRLTPA
jgi:hypothetical protein